MSAGNLGNEVADRLIRTIHKSLERYTEEALKTISIWIIAISYVFDRSFCDSFLWKLLEGLKEFDKHVFILLRSDAMRDYQMEGLKDGLVKLAKDYQLGIDVLSSPKIHAKGIGVFLRAPFYQDELGIVAALGSMNFTESSMQRSHEMMIILKDESSIKKFFKTFLGMLGKSKGGGTFTFMINKDGTIREHPFKRRRRTW
jgi:phosphatidylserine/phosphatidylglycerophosphate/cardiolipin synthase-like enzyme